MAESMCKLYNKKGGEFKFVGKLGGDISLEDGQAAARLCAVNIISQLKDACGGDLDRVARIVKLGGFVNSTPEFTDQPKVINGASALMAEVFGDKGKHARAAVSAGALPLGVAGLGLSLYTGGWVQSVAGGLAGYALIAGLAAFWRSQRGYEGIGLGDAKLLAASGFWVGVFALPVILLVASILGLVIALIMAKATRSDDINVAIPFGPFLALGTWAAWCGAQNLFVN